MSQDMNAPAGGQQFNVGNVLGTSFSILIRNLVPFLVLALIFSVPTLVVDWLMDPSMNASLEPVAATDGATFIHSAVSFVVNMVCSGMISGSLIFGTFQDLRGQRFSFSECLSRAFLVVVPVAIASIGFSLLVGVGLLLLVIPGIMLAVIYWFVVPAIVAERASVGAAFSRSADLTRGRRWTVFGLLLVVAVLSLVVAAVAAVVLSMGGVVVLLIGLFAVGAVLSAYGAVVNAVGYYYLRADKEGVDIDQIAKVFD